MEKECTVYGFLTRDKSRGGKPGRLTLHSGKPYRFKIFGEWSKGLANLPPTYFPDLKWEDEALEVALTITPLKK